MIVVRRAQERRCDSASAHEVWLSFDPSDPTEPFAGTFGTLASLDEDRLPPGANTAIPPCDQEILTYVHEGTLSFRDSSGRTGILQAGEFQRMVPTQGRISRQRNASRTNWAYIYRIHLRSTKSALKAGWEQKRFTAGDRKGRLCLIASPDARSGSLGVNQDALMYSALLERGQHLFHELSPGRGAWLQVVHGSISLDNLVLATGDGAGITDECAVSFTALADTTILLFDVAEIQSGVADSTLEPMGLAAGIALALVPETEPLYCLPAARLAGAAVFKILWEVLVDVLGSAATATILSRAARRAQARCPELAEFTITRVGPEYRYALPRSLDQGQSQSTPLNAFLDEIRVLLLEQTGRVVLRSFDGVPELKTWAA